ncbi:nucleoid-associated protein [Rheinheimera hassiensis]|uniref:nucleoid-associated protein n=1 Tax=Rheinheimera hassiensis TaxID=1193627 RepID=UPI001F06EE6F|nr:nucleoid-associated protein [Rheinheimera hassiensis]
MAILNKFIIHELFRDREPNVADALLDISNDIISNLGHDLVKVKDKRTAVLWGQFRENGKFPNHLKTLNNASEDKKLNDIFIKLSHSAMGCLYEEIKHTNSNGGYICFIEYTAFKQTRMLVVMITNTSGVKLTDLTPTTDIHVDISKLHQAVDINITGYISSTNGLNDKNYLSFIGRGKHTEYFTNAFDCSNRVTPSKMPSKAVEVLKDFLASFSVDKRTQKSAKEQLVKYFTENIGKEVFLSKVEDIAKAHLPDTCTDEEKESFIAFCKQDKYQMPSSFLAAKKPVDKLAKINYSTDSFSFNFEIEDVGLIGNISDVDKRIIFNPANDDIIIKGGELPQHIKSALMEHVDIANIDNKS